MYMEKHVREKKNVFGVFTNKNNNSSQHLMSIATVQKAVHYNEQLGSKSYLDLMMYNNEQTCN